MEFLEFEVPIKEILDQIEKNHEVDLPQNLLDQEISIMTKNLKPEDKEKHKLNNEKLAKSRIKLGLLLNEYGEKNKDENFTAKDICMKRNIRFVYNKRDHDFSTSSLRKRIYDQESTKRFVK